MTVRELEILRQKIQALIQSNDSLMLERKSFAEKVLLREKQIRELRDRCERYERNRKEAYQRISAMLDRMENIK